MNRRSSDTQYDSRGEVKQVLTVAAEAAANPLLKSLPPIWKGLEQADSGDLYLAGTTAVAPVNGRYLSQAARGDSNPYRFDGNEPLADIDAPRHKMIGDKDVAGPGYFHYLSHPWEMDTDLQVAFWTANIVGVASGGATGILARLGIGTTSARGLREGSADQLPLPVREIARILSIRYEAGSFLGNTKNTQGSQSRYLGSTQFTNTF